MFTWTTPQPRAITVAELVAERDRHGRKLAVIGFSEIEPGSLRGKLCAFDAERPSLDDPFWCSGIGRDDVPPIDRPGFSPKNFGVGFTWLVNVFDEPRGDELVVMYQHTFSRRAIRVVSLEGETLYQVWHDGVISSVVWLPNPKLLILSGENGDVYWEYRDHALAAAVTKTYPFVVFALRPERGLISNQYVNKTASDSRLRPVWYKCLLPPTSSDEFSGLELNPYPDLKEWDDGLHVEVTAPYRRESGTEASWFLDEFGNTVPGANVRGDSYNRNPQLPRMEDFEFGELPPVRPSDPERSR